MSGAFPSCCLHRLSELLPAHCEPDVYDRAISLDGDVLKQILCESINLLFGEPEGRDRAL